MAFSPAFSVAQSIGLTDLILTDTSTGVDAAITQRYIYLLQSNGQYLVPDGTLTDYIVWPLSDGLTKTLSDILTIDYALNIKVEWRSNSAVLYSAEDLFDLPGQAKDFAYYLVQLAAGNPRIVDRSNFFQNTVQLYVFIKNSEAAVTRGGDIASAQQQLNNARNLTSQPGVFFT